MGNLKSKEFAGDPKLEACAVSDPAHITPGMSGEQVGKIQAALLKIGGVSIDPAEVAAKRYGKSTAAAVAQFKRARNILNYAGRIDDIVGKKTIRALDDELVKGAAPTPPVPPTPPPQPPGPPKVFIVHDVRLFGWKPQGDVLEVNGDTPLQWMLDNIVTRGKENGGNLVVKVMAHGLPGFVQCCRGIMQHPTLADAVTDPAKGNLYIGPGKGGFCVQDLNAFKQLTGM